MSFTYHTLPRCLFSCSDLISSFFKEPNKVNVVKNFWQLMVRDSSISKYCIKAPISSALKFKLKVLLTALLNSKGVRKLGSKLMRLPPRILSNLIEASVSFESAEFKSFSTKSTAILTFSLLSTESTFFKWSASTFKTVFLCLQNK